MIMGISPASITAWTCCWFPAVILERNQTASYNGIKQKSKALLKTVSRWKKELNQTRPPQNLKSYHEQSLKQASSVALLAHKLLLHYERQQGINIKFIWLIHRTRFSLTQGVSPYTRSNTDGNLISTLHCWSHRQALNLQFYRENRKTGKAP